MQSFLSNDLNLFFLSVKEIPKLVF